MANILFLSLLDFSSFSERNIYTDLLREFIKQGHKVFAISPIERRKSSESQIIRDDNNVILKPSIGNIQKTSIIEKGISTLTIEPKVLRVIKATLTHVKFNLVLYATPPITFCKVIEYVKKRDNAKSFLLLKDIFPQNAVDLGLMSKRGLKAPLYRYFRNKEKRLYDISDHIGCMSQANVDYVLKHNPNVAKRNSASIYKNGKGIIDVCPNCIEPIDMSLSIEERNDIRQKYRIPLDKTVFVYGGNLGKPQGIDFMLECLKSQADSENVFFLIIGDGTEYDLIDNYLKENRPRNVMLHQWLPKEDYDKVVAACDVGMIFLDHRFTIPNFPSRLLSYMQARLPVLAVTDVNTDIGKVIVEGNFGWWCESNYVDEFITVLNRIVNSNHKDVGIISFNYMKEHFSVKTNISNIISGIK